MQSLYPSMRRYAEKLITELNPLCRHGFGDWVAVKLNKPGDLFSCRTTPNYTSTAYAYRTLVEMAAMAKILGKSDDVALNDDQLCEIIRDNPAGQDDQCTPFMLIRRK
jgi:hypothetical protein